MHEGPSRIGHLFELVRSGTQHHLLGCSSGLIAVAPRNEGRSDSRNSGLGEHLTCLKTSAWFEKSN